MNTHSGIPLKKVMEKGYMKYYGIIMDGVPNSPKQKNSMLLSWQG